MVVVWGPFSCEFCSDCFRPEKRVTFGAFGMTMKAVPNFQAMGFIFDSYIQEGTTRTHRSLCLSSLSTPKQTPATIFFYGHPCQLKATLAKRFIEPFLPCTAWPWCSCPRNDQRVDPIRDFLGIIGHQNAEPPEKPP